MGNTRFTSIHETTRYRIVIDGVQSRPEAEAIVLAVEAMPKGSAWIPGYESDDAVPAPALSPEIAALQAHIDAHDAERDLALRAGSAEHAP